jgi:hypothetical protein
MATSTSGASPGVVMSWSRCAPGTPTPGQRPGRRPDLRREVGHGRQVVAEAGGHAREAVTGELHAVARVTGEADDDPVDGDGFGGGSAHVVSLPGDKAHAITPADEP